MGTVGEGAYLHADRPLEHVQCGGLALLQHLSRARTVHFAAPPSLSPDGFQLMRHNMREARTISVEWFRLSYM